MTDLESQEKFIRHLEKTLDEEKIEKNRLTQEVFSMEFKLKERSDSMDLIEGEVVIGCG